MLCRIVELEIGAESSRTLRKKKQEQDETRAFTSPTQQTLARLLAKKATRETVLAASGTADCRDAAMLRESRLSKAEAERESESRSRMSSRQSVLARHAHFRWKGGGGEGQPDTEKERDRETETEGQN